MTKKMISLHHFYYGNPFGAGQDVVASSYSDTTRIKDSALNNWMIGEFKDEYRWREVFTDFMGTGFFSYKNGSTFAFLKKILKSDDRLPFLYHWVVISRSDIVNLAGHWHYLTDKVREQDQLFINQLKGSYSRQLQQIEILLPNDDNEMQQLLVQYFPVHDLGRTTILEKLMALALSQSNIKVGIMGLDNNEHLREQWILALNALLPPPLRSSITYSTRELGKGNPNNRFIFLNPDDKVICTHYWDVNTDQLTGAIPDSSLMIKMLINAYKTQSLSDYHRQWHDRAMILSLSQHDMLDIVDKFDKWIIINDIWESQPQKFLDVIWTSLLQDDSLTQEEHLIWFDRSLKYVMDDLENKLSDTRLYQNIHLYLKNKPYLMPNFQSRIETYLAGQKNLHHLMIWLRRLNDHGNKFIDHLLTEWSLQSMEIISIKKDINAAIAMLGEIIYLPNTMSWLIYFSHHISLINQAKRLQSSIKDYPFTVLNALLDRVSGDDFIQLITTQENHWLSYLPQTYQDLFLSNDAKTLLPIMDISKNAIKVLTHFSFYKQDILAFDSPSIILRMAIPYNPKIFQWLAHQHQSLQFETVIEIIIVLLRQKEIESLNHIFHDPIPAMQIVQQYPFVRTSIEEVSWLWEIIKQTPQTPTKSQMISIVFSHITDKQYNEIPSIGAWVIQELLSENSSSIEELLPLDDFRVQKRLFSYPARQQDERMGNRLLDWGFAQISNILQSRRYDITFQLLEVMKISFKFSETLSNKFNDSLNQQYYMWPSHILEQFILYIEQSPERKIRMNNEYKNARTTRDFRTLLPSGSLRGLLEHAQTTRIFFEALYNMEENEVNILELAIRDMAKKENISSSELKDLKNNILSIAEILDDLSQEFDKKEYKNFLPIGRPSKEQITEQLFDGQRKPKSRLGLWYWISGRLFRNNRR